MPVALPYIVAVTSPYPGYTVANADPTAVVGRRIAAALIDLVLLLLIGGVVIVPKWNSESVVVDDGTVRCASDNSASSDDNFNTPFRDRAKIDSSLCIDLDGTVHYIP